ncbi:hypothetical protein EVAR_42624_1 [Eumeta japonica]|uniref:Uncharacterized protein n=1 Tax=Eumeta variegata TaxID=151549 RepID=A0A4C1WVJ2_EUMVA|nr:hypothetical protein EVAR_42624_1 [Eumeta japonica]
MFEKRLGPWQHNWLNLNGRTLGPGELGRAGRLRPSTRALVSEWRWRRLRRAHGAGRAARGRGAARCAGPGCRADLPAVRRLRRPTYMHFTTPRCDRRTSPHLVPMYASATKAARDGECGRFLTASAGDASRSCASRGPRCERDSAARCCIQVHYFRSATAAVTALAALGAPAVSPFHALVEPCG